ncbi:MAG: type II toxin-antitoxin system RelE family toxin [Candidatus Aminicenantaceae bacterium]
MWKISSIAKSASKNIKNLDRKFQKEVIQELDCLEQYPFFGNIKKVEGKKDIYRKKWGDYRFYFKVFPKSREIHILLFEYRGKIKKKTIQRLK